jgi:hypothetical protein
MKNKRGQRGSIRVESGSWIGYWNTYQYNEDTDQNVRKQRSKVLGPRSLSKFQAYKELAKHIEQSKEQIQRPDSAITLETFTRTRWLRLREATWRPSTRASAEHVLGHVLGTFGKVPLERLDTIAIQIWLNGLAETHSDSVVKHCRIYIKSILEEAVDPDYLRKNMAKKVTLPNTRQVEKAILTQDQVNAVFAELDEKHALLLDVCTACALRPSSEPSLPLKVFA